MSRQIVIGEACPFAAGFLLAGLTLGQRTAAERRGFVFRTIDANFSSHKQAEDIDSLIELGVDGITTWTLDPETAEPALARAHAAGIALVGINSESLSFDAVVKLATDASPQPAEDAAGYIAERVPVARVAVVAAPPVPALAFRTASFLEAAPRHGLEVIASVEFLGDFPGPAEALVVELLSAHPGLDAVWCWNDPGAIGAGRALRSAGLAAFSGSREGVIVVGINGSQEAIDDIAAGSITVTYDANPIDAGIAAIDALGSLLGGDGRQAPSGEILVPYSRFDSSNLDDYVTWETRALLEGGCQAG